MSAPFIYDKFVTGKNFIGRKENCSILENLISQGCNVTIYEPPKSGKKSIIQQSLFNLRVAQHEFISGELSLLNIRETEEFIRQFGEAIIRPLGSTADEYKELIDNYLSGTHFLFDIKEFADKDRILSTNWDIDEKDKEAILRLPFIISSDKNKHFILILEEFQNIDFLEDSYHILKMMEKILGEYKNNNLCNFIFTGSMVNGMKDIFENRRLFYRLVDHLSLNKVDEKEIIEYVVKGFLSGGKVVEKELLINICKIFNNNLCYINHFISICDSMSKGYIIESILMDALRHLVSIHEPRFIFMANNLTTNQLHLLRAILDGKTKFSAAPIIQEYKLNSSANVKRVKDALLKKEVISFNENDEPYLLDPLFEYWIRKFFYKIN